jgi:hypothetical protein
MIKTAAGKEVPYILLYPATLQVERYCQHINIVRTETKNVCIITDVKKQLKKSLQPAIFFKSWAGLYTK